jgi:hypothetical protein
MHHIMLLGLLSVDRLLLCGVYIFLGQQTLHFGSNFVVNNCLVVFSNNIDTIFLGPIEKPGVQLLR